MGKTSQEFQAFDSAMRKLLTVPKSTIVERHEAHKKKAALNPKDALNGLTGLEKSRQKQWRDRWSLIEPAA